MALFKKTLKRYKRMGIQNKYADYFADKKAKGELKSALTLAQWIKAGKPMPKKRKVKKYIAPARKKKYPTHLGAIEKGVREAGISKEKFEKLKGK